MFSMTFLCYNRSVNNLLVHRSMNFANSLDYDNLCLLASEINVCAHL